MQLIQTMPDLERLAGHLAGEGLVAADTEAAGYHRYTDRLCLLQLSTRDATWIVDTVALASLNPLAEAFESPSIEMVFHDADYDIRLLDRDFAIRVRRLFDTQIAARFAGARSFGLASVLGAELGVELEKKYQRADWARRPLSGDMLEYAAMDTRFLPRLRDLLRDRLEALGRLGWAEEEFRIQESIRWEPTADGDEAHRRIKGAYDLDPRSMAALAELYRWREEVARERDVAPFRVVTNEVLLEAARRMPDRPGALDGIRGLSAGNLRRYGDALLAAVDRARRLPEHELPEPVRRTRRPPRDPALEARVDRLRRVRDRSAEKLDLEPGFLMPRSQLELVAAAEPRDLASLRAVDGIRRWQVEAMGDGLIGALRENGREPIRERSAHGD